MSHPFWDIEIDGYKSIGRAAMRFGSLNVLIGANGAGKSNVVQVFELLGRLVDQELGLFVGIGGGASALLNVHSDERFIRVLVEAGAVRYQVTLTPAAGDELVFLNEWVTLGERNRSIGQGQRETRLFDDVSPDDGDSLTAPVVTLLKGCRVYHFHDTSLDAPVKTTTSTADNLALRADAGNLAAVLLALRDGGNEERAAYRRIVNVIRQVAPFFHDFVLEPENADRIRLRWREAGTDAVFMAEQMSDGTLRFVCLAALLLSPGLPGLVVLDEPELGLHPSAIAMLAGLLRQASTRSQVVVATQSVTLVNQVDLDDLVIVERAETGTILRRPDRERLTGWLDEYSLGELWEKNVIGGRPGKAGGSVA